MGWVQFQIVLGRCSLLTLTTEEQRLDIDYIYYIG